MNTHHHPCAQPCLCAGMNPCQLQLYTTIRRLWVEHTLWTRALIISALNGLSDVDAVTTRLLRNPADFAQILQPYYGEQTAAQFEQLLADHLLIAAQWLQALQANDMQETQNQRDQWFANADDISLFLSEINPCWSFETWQMMLYEHLEIIERFTLHLLGGNYPQSVEQTDIMLLEVLEMADLMACGMIEQFCI